MKELIFSPESRSYSEWKSPNVDLFLDVYMFNWTNAEDFGNSKIELQEVGPFRFKERRHKTNVTFNEENSTVTYFPVSHYFFVPGDSPLSDEITSIDIVTIGAGDSALGMNKADKRKVSVGLESYEKSISISKTAAEFLFEGYEDDLLTLSRTPGAIDESFMKVPEVPFDKIGWFYTVSKHDIYVFEFCTEFCTEHLNKIFLEKFVVSRCTLCSYWSERY